jgi:hypothetical protein
VNQFEQHLELSGKPLWSGDLTETSINLAASGKFLFGFAQRYRNGLVTRLTRSNLCADILTDNLLRFTLL